MLVIEFRNNHMFIVEGKVSNKKISIKKTLSVPLDESWTSNQGVVQIDVMADFLDDQLTKNGFKNRKDVSICFNQFNSIFRELTVPAVSGKKLTILVRSEMINTLNLTNDYLVDYVVLKETQDDDGNKLNVLAVALQERFLESYLKVCKKANLRVKVADFGTNTMIKMMEASNHLHLNQLSIVANLSPTHLRMHLFDSYDYTFTRTVTLSNTDDLELEVIDNLNKMIQFMYTKVNVQDYSQIILTGHDGLVAGLSEAVQTSLEVPCEIFQIPPHIINHTNEDIGLYINAIGTMVRRGKS